MLVPVTAPLKDTVTICGVCSTLTSAAPGITVPSAEQKQSGRTQSARLHLGALLAQNTVETDYILPF